MVGWFGAASLALVGGLKGQGNPWRQIPLVGVLAATALFISWSVRHSRDKDTSKLASPDDNTVAEVNTRVYLVYDEEKKLECSTSQSPPTSFEREFENPTDTDSGSSTSVEVEVIAENSFQTSQGHSSESENRKGGENWSRTVNVSRGDSECKDVDGISKAETTIHDVKASASKPVPSPASKITDISVSGLLLPQIKNQKFLINPEIPSVEKEEPVVSFESVTGYLKGEIDNSLSDCPVGDVLHHHEDVFPVMDSDVTSNRPQQDEFSSGGDSKQIILGQMKRLEKVLNVVKPYKDSENGMGVLSNKLQEVRQVPAHSLEVFDSNNSSTLTHALDMSGMRKDDAAADRESSTLREIRATWISQELQYDRVSSRGDSELGNGRLAHPASVTESYPSAVAESVTGTFPFPSNSTSESRRDSDVMDCKDEFRLQSPPSNVKRIIPLVKDLEPDSRKSSEEQYAERLRVYDEYLGDPSLSPTMRSQVVRAKVTLERLLYDSD